MSEQTLFFKEINPQECFAELDRHAVLYRKNVLVRARPAVLGERVTTVTSGNHVETVNTAKAGDMLVVNPGGEAYLIPEQKFESRYALENGAANPGEFRTYRANGAAVPCIRLEQGESVEFKAAWGETMRIKAGGMLVSAGSNDIYGIGAEEFEQTYRPCFADGTFIDDDTWSQHYTQACDDAWEAWKDTNTFQTQREVEHKTWLSIIGSR